MPGSGGAAGSESLAEPPAGRTTVIIADGELLFARALAVALGDYPDISVIEEHPAAGGDVLRSAMAHRPNVLVIDVHIPGTTAAAATRMLRQWMPRLQVVMLTWLPPRMDENAVLVAGGAALLSKSCEVHDVVDAIRKAREGKADDEAERAARLEVLRASRADAEERWARLRRLSPRELEVLQQLSQGYPIREAAENLSISMGTIKNHVTSVLSKTGARTQVEAVNLARYEGLIRELGPPYTAPDTPDVPEVTADRT